jgi:hypothetical protein
LEIERKIVNVQGLQPTLAQMGILLANNGDFQTAITYGNALPKTSERGGTNSAQNLTAQGQIVCKSIEGVAFADRDFGDEFQNCGANATPLRACGDKSLLLTYNAILGFYLQRRPRADVFCDRIR